MKPLFLAGVLAAAAYGVFTIMGGGTSTPPPISPDDGWSDGPLAGGPGMPPPLGTMPPPLGGPGTAPTYTPGAPVGAAPPYSAGPVGDAPTYQPPAEPYASEDPTAMSSGMAPPVGLAAPGGPSLAAPGSVPAGAPADPTGMSDSLAAPTGTEPNAGLAAAPYGQPDANGQPDSYGQPDVYGNVTPQVNEFGRDAELASADGGSSPAAMGTAAGASGFAVAMTSIQAQLQRQQLADAQHALSQWYGDPSLSASEEEQLLALLDQLTGTVVYSRQHFLEPAYVTREGDTLESVAGQFNVPARLLANVNAVSETDPLPPGTELKVMTGPFAASLDLNSYRLTLWLGDRYAGRFNVGIGSEQPIEPREYVVETKITNPTYYGSELTIGKDDPTNPLGEYWIGLGGNVGVHGTIDPHSVGAPAKEGCVRLSERDIEDVFHILSIGSHVIVHESIDTSTTATADQGAPPQSTPPSSTAQLPGGPSPGSPSQPLRY
ncbi:MAG: LysM peptidoglycan-binding domain-containing protein [Pirellulales bacterium]|nr:LysM peptidoglycan-binding domain-containing protein [Planctomycetales bacterium]